MTGKLPEDLKRDMDYWRLVLDLIYENHNLCAWYLTYLQRLESLARQIPRPE